MTGMFQPRLCIVVPDGCGPSHPCNEFATLRHVIKSIKIHFFASYRLFGHYFDNFDGCIKLLLRRLDGAWLAATICETEAYVGRIDKACHAYAYRRTPRTETLFAPPGTAYVYFVYGMHHCLNAVTEPEGEPSAVLIRAARPLLGHDAMALRRHGRPWADLTAAQRRNLLTGPGRLCQALGIDRAFDRASLILGPDLIIAAEAPELGLRARRPRGILATPRIGIDYAEEARAFPWRFLWPDPPPPSPRASAAKSPSVGG